VARRILWGSLALAPATIFIHYAFHPGEVVEFVLAAASLVPLAWLIGEATEQAAHHTGPGIGGFLNATFGNAPELIIALFAVNEAKFEVVRGSLTGSVVGNLLLVLGFSLLFGGRGPIDRESSFVSLGLIAFAVLMFLIPSVPGWEGDPERDFIAKLSVPVSIVLLLVYLGVTWLSLRRHRRLHISDQPPEIMAWSFGMALLVLGLATVVTAVIAEILVGSIDVFATEAHLSEFFVAAVIVAIVGNAAEHGGAVVVAARGQIKLAAEIALASSAQVAVFLIPAVALLSWLIDPLALSFRMVELAAVAAATVFTFALLVQGQSSRGRGVALIVGYVAVAAAFFVAGER
jgi:Ca2+:H+ antiporter